MLCKNILERVFYELHGIVRAPLMGTIDRTSKAYLDGCGVTQLLSQGDPDEIEPVYRDLAYLHRLVRQRKPMTIVEFGVGLSTITLAHALEKNALENGERKSARLHTLDTSEHWLNNTRDKLPGQLAEFVELHSSTARLSVINGELCHLFDELPNVVPDLIYLDGPDPSIVEGRINGLTNTVERGEPRRAMSADPLLYEAGLKIGATIVVDNRRMNTRFLRRNLKRRWRFQANKAEGRYTFTLRD